MVDGITTLCSPLRLISGLGLNGIKAPIIIFSIYEYFCFYKFTYLSDLFDQQSHMTDVTAAVATRTRYGLGIKLVTIALFILKNRENNEEDDIGLVSPALGVAAIPV